MVVNRCSICRFHYRQLGQVDSKEAWVWRRRFHHKS
jgi:hypothetical protein